MHKILLLLILAVCTTSCSPLIQKSRVNSTSSNSPTELNIALVETVEGQAQKDIANTNSSFLVPVEKNGVAWDRLWAFFKFHIKSQPNYNEKQDRVVGDSRKYRYLVSREYKYKLESFKYDVSCKEKATGRVTSKSLANAKNLARFMQEGTLEASLLDL